MALRVLRVVLLVAGLGLFGWLLAAAGPRELLEMVLRMHWGIAAVLGFYLVIIAMDTWGWHFSFVGDQRRSCRWLDLFAVRLAGEAINYVTPMATLGGEPVKADLLKRGYRLPLAEGLASLVVAKTAIAVSLVLFVGSGLAVAWGVGQLPSSLNRFIAVTLALFVALVIGFVISQQTGVFRWMAGGVRWIPGLRRVLEEKWHRITALDTSLAQFYRRSDLRVIWSVMFHLLGWVAGVAEVYLILRFLGVDLAIWQAWVIESFWQLIRTASFLVPASLGAQEGGVVLVAAGLGIASPMAMAVALVRRIRELVWTGVGLGLWWWFERRLSTSGTRV